MSLIKKMSEEDKERFEIFSRLPNDEKVKLLMRYRKRIDKAIEYIKVKARDNCWIDQYEASDLIKILRGDSDE